MRAGTERTLLRPRTNRRPRVRKEDGPPLEDLTRSELYERARDLGVRGRSNMNKAQLVRAIRSKR